MSYTSQNKHRFLNKTMFVRKIITIFFVFTAICLVSTQAQTGSNNSNSKITRIPVNGNIFGKGAPTEVATIFNLRNVTAELSSDKSKLNCLFFANKGFVQLTPEIGVWSLVEGNAVSITLKNTGKTAVTPKLQITSSNNQATDLAVLEKPLAPGAVATLVASFIPQTPWVAGEIKETYNGIKPGTGTLFENNTANGIFLFAEEGARMEVTAVTLIAPPANLPEWLGKQPPVPQSEWKDWKITFDENFDKPLDLKVWNIYTDNYWDRRTHFTKDNNIVKDGKMILRYEKKRGYHNDDSNETFGENGQTDYACGHADTYGKWTQRYGYYEARMKLPTANGLWPAFWMMPDRGLENGPQQSRRASTSNGGMELDIMEHLSGWGVYRFNQAFHWDGYGNGHRSVGSSNVYVQSDKDGYITIGLLWLPGLAVYYSNGEEIGRFESERIGSVQSNLIFYMVSGGWANTRLYDSELADPKISKDFVADYIRVWQRNDLATPEDGFKPNDGRPKMHSQRTDGN